MDLSNMTGVILAGGRSSRMGKDKGLVDVQGKPLFEHVAERLQSQVGEILISCNQNADRYGREFKTVPDIIQDFSGPLAGMLAALKMSKTEWVLFVPCDVPGFPANLVDAFLSNILDHQAIYARDHDREHPTLCLLNRSIIPELAEYLSRGDRKLMIFFNEINAKSVLFNNAADFLNLNTPEDVLLWENGQTGFSQ